MSNLTVREHFSNDLFQLKQDFEKVFHHLFKPHVVPSTTAETVIAAIPPIETWIDTEDKEFHLSVPLPGIKPDALQITLQGNYLTFNGELEEEEDSTGKNYLEREFCYGRFARSVRLPEGVDGDKMTAELKHGVLEIVAPIAASALPKKIVIKNAPELPAAATQGASK